MNQSKNKDQKAEFAVVGRVNEGKSSIISTLIEKDTLKIGPLPGTTSETSAYEWKLGNGEVFTVYDTPGFQAPEEVLQWLKADPLPDVVQRPMRVRDFLHRFSGSGEYHDECHLLTPIMNGATILYVADLSHPFRPSFAAELEILQWTGLPRIALLNKRGEYEEQWRAALSQYFHVIVDFDAHSPVHKQKQLLLEALAVIRPDLQQRIKRLLTEIVDLQKSRTLEVAELMARYLQEATTWTLDVPASTPKQQAIDKFQDGLRKQEETFRGTLEVLLGYSDLQVEDNLKAPDLEEDDLFQREVWSFLGLDRLQLIKLSSMGGAAAGMAVDIGTGFHSFGAGSVTGALAAAGAALYASRSAPEKLIGLSVQASNLRVGPFKGYRFAWILLDRCLIHFKSLRMRTHAMRTNLVLHPDSSIMRELPEKTQMELQKALVKVGKNDIEPLRQALNEILGTF